MISEIHAMKKQALLEFFILTSLLPPKCYGFVSTHEYNAKTLTAHEETPDEE